MSAFGFLLVLGGFLSYFTLIFVFQRFTYKTWIFNIIIGVGIAMAVLSWFQSGTNLIFWSTIIVGVAWFILSKVELRLTGSKKLKLKQGSNLPAMTFTMIDGSEISEQYLIDKAPVLLVLYRGWWCPSSKTQLNEIIQQYEQFSKLGVKIYAASVDDPIAAAPLQEYVGGDITILCNVSESFLDSIGVRDPRGAPWYDRILFGAPKQDISMPSAIVINKNGKVVFAARSLQEDNRPRINDMLASLK